MDWPTHGGDPGHRQFSTLDQINTGNVGALKVAWTYRTRDAQPDNRSQIQCNPIVVHGVLYGTSAALKTFALDAATGRELWVFDPFAGGGARQRVSSLGVNRGVVFWEGGDDRRILVAAGQRLYALDARTGKPVPSFGANGSVSLLEGLGRDVSNLYVLSNTPGAIYKDLLILGTRVSEGPGPSAPGHIRAYDVRTGKIRWTFQTIPSPGEFGYDTWPKDAWTRVGGANAWSGISVDTARGLVFLPIGSAAFDFWGGNRHGANLFANCVLALKADTGERVWHYQLVHHDLWDRDPPAAPVLVTVQRDGRRVDAVAQVTKSGHVFLFDREKGTPLFPIEERPVPPSDLKGEAAWPTQPLPLAPPPFSRQRLTEADLTTITPAAQAAVLAQFRKVRSNGQFVPPSTQGTVIFPGFDGGGEWGGSAFDEAHRAPLRERERDAVDSHDGGAEAGRHRTRRRGQPDLRPELRGVPRRGAQGRCDEGVPVPRRCVEEADARAGRADHPARQGRHALVRLAQHRGAQDARRVSLRRRGTAARAARRRGRKRRRRRRSTRTPATTASSIRTATRR